MKTYTTVIVLVTLLLSSNAFAGLFDDAVSGDASVSTSSGGDGTAETGGEEGGEVAAAPVTVVNPLKFDLNGYVRGDLWAGKMPDYSRAEMKNGYGELALKLLVSKGNYGSAYGEVRFKGGYLKDGYYLAQPSETLMADEDLGKASGSVQLREAYVNLYAGKLELRLGHQIVLWGRADGINPTNNITPIDMRVRSPEEDDRRLANTGLRAKLNLSPVRIEAIWMPFYNASLMPQVVISEALRFTQPDYPDFDVANGLFAGKIDLVLPAIEMSVSYLNGYSLTPGIAYASNNFSIGFYDPDYDLTPDPYTVTLARTAYRHQVVGFDFSTTLGSFMGLRGEVAFRYPEKQNEDAEDRLHIPNPDLYYVLGADKEFGNLMVVAQYIGRYVLDYDNRPNVFDADTEADLDEIGASIELDNLEEAGNPADRLVEYSANKELVPINQMIHGQTQEIQHGVSLRLSYTTLHDTLTFIVFGMANLSTEEIVVYPKVQYTLTDAMTLSVGAELYFGPEDTLFGLIDETLSAGYAEMKVSF